MMGGASQTHQAYSNFGFGERQSNRKQTQQAKTVDLDVTKNLNVTAKEIFDNKPITVTFNEMEKCTNCNGNGYCSVCNGTGIVSKNKTVKVKLPKGVKEGTKIRLKSEGKSDNYGNKGDLYFIIHFKDAEYELDDNNLIKEVEITPSEAVLGCTKDINTLHGKINIKIPPLISSGQSLRLKQLGLPQSNGYGDLKVKIKIVIPKNLSNEIIDLYKKIDKLMK